MEKDKEDKGKKETKGKVKILFNKYMEKNKELNKNEPRLGATINSEDAEELFEKYDRLIISLEADIENLPKPSNRLNELLKLFKTKKKYYGRVKDRKN